MIPSRRHSPQRLLKLLSLSLVALPAVICRGLTPGQPAGASIDRLPKAPLRAFGAVHPRISPDGKEIVLSYQGTVWRLPSEGGCMRRLAAGSGFAFEPCWSPDGRRVAFLQGRSWTGGQVRMVDAQAGTPLTLPRAVLGTGKVFFTPDGTHLVGNLRGERQLEALRSLDLTTGELKTLLRLPSVRQPWALSDDGHWIAYLTTLDVSEQQTGNDGPQVDLWKVPVAGGEPQRLVRFPARIHDICWSADGKALFVSGELGGVHNDLWRIDLSDPEHPVKLTFGQADEDRPSVSRDGRQLLYTDNQEGCPALVLRELVSGTSRPLVVERLDYGLPTGRLRLSVCDKSTGQPLVARVALEHADGSFHAPPGALWRIYNDKGHFYVREHVELDLPVGVYRVRAWHGPEYRLKLQTIEVKAGGRQEQSLALERWTDANARGWYSGENHIHANYGYGEYYNSPADMADMCAGEGLNVANLMVANSDGDGVFDREYFRGRPDPVSTPQSVLYWNEEFRSTIWGHMTLVNLKHVVEPVFTGFKDTTNPYDIPTMSEIAWKTQRQGGLVNYTHPASQPNDLYRGAYSAKGLPVFAALGKIDTMDVMGSGDRASTALYHRLLNCGFRLAASAGTDCFLNRIRGWLPGGERAYVKIDDPFTYEKWIAGLRAGRSFVTNGPMLDLSVEGKGIADTVHLAGAGEIQVKGVASSQFPLSRVELLYNGAIVAASGGMGDGLPTKLEKRIRIDGSGWLALRASGPAVPEIQGEMVLAHTSPVYVLVADKPGGSAEDARYFLQWIDRLALALQERDRFPDHRSRDGVFAEIEEARKVYRGIIDREQSR
jgi:hypothetical protein